MAARHAEQISSVHYLRGVACVAVLLYHFDAHFQIPGIAARGYAGIDLFFILSGFLMHQVTAVGHPSARDFLIRRFFRLIPLSWVMIAIWATYRRETWQRTFTSLAFIPLSSTDVPPQLGLSVVSALWTVSYEIWFYVIFAVGLAVSHRYRAVIASALVASTVLVLQLAVSGTFTINPRRAAVFFPLPNFPEQMFSVVMNPLMLEFVVGMAIGGLFDRYAKSAWALPKPFRFAASAASAILSAVIYFYWKRGGSGLDTVGLFAPALVVAGLLIEPELARTAGRRLFAPLRFISDVSFSLYLSHLSVQHLLVKSGIFGSLYPSVGTGLVVFSASLCTAWLIYVGLEKPFIRLGRKVSARFAKSRAADLPTRKAA